MANSNGIIAETGTIPLIADICKVLGVNNTNLNYLCSNGHGKTNLWSKRKPVRRKDDPFPDRSKDWWKGTAGDCGLIPNVVDNYSDLLSAAMGGNAGWGYAAPIAGSDMRQVDFSGYDHYTPCVVAGWSVPMEVARGDKILATIETNYLSGHDVIGFSDLELYGRNLNAYHFGMVAVDSVGTIVAITFSDTNAGGEIATLQWNDNKTYTIYPFWSLNKPGEDYIFSTLEGALTEPIPMNGNTVITIPNCPPKQVKITAMSILPEVRIELSGYKAAGRIVVNVALTPTYATTLQSCVVELHNYGSTIIQSSYTVAGLPRAVAKGQRFTDSFEITDFVETRNYELWLRLTTSAGQYTQKVEVN